MNAKQYLRQIKRLDNIIQAKAREIDDLHDQATALGGLDYAKDRVQTSPNPDAPYVKTLAMLSEIEQELIEDIKQLNELKSEIRTSIDAVEDKDERLLLELRYLCGCTWEQIQEEMNCSHATVHRIHKRALRDIS